MDKTTTAPAAPTAVGYWNAFAEAVAGVLSSGPSASRDTLLHALDACHGELIRVHAHHPPYDADPGETAARVGQAAIALSSAIREARAAGGPERRTGTGAAHTTVTRPERGVVAENVPDAPVDPGPVPAAGGGPEAAPEPVAVEQLSKRLNELCAELGRRHGRHLGGWRHARPGARFGAVEPAEPAVTWRALHMALLRLPDADCRLWRERAAKAAQECLGGPVPAHPDPSVIVSGLRGPEAPSAPGGSDLLAQEVAVPLDLSDPEALKKAAADAPSDILEALGIIDVEALEHGDLRLLHWAARAGQALRLAGIDPELQAVNYPRSNLVALAEEGHRSKYRTTLKTHLKGAAEAHRNKHENRSRLRSAHKLDGVLGGLLHWPTAAPDSWWWRWRREVSLILEPLAHAVDHEVVFDKTSEWRKADLENCTETEAGLGGERAPDERLVQWVFLTPLRRTDVAEPRSDFPGRVVRRPDPPSTRGATP